MTAKKRMINYLRIKGISQYEFSKNTGLSNGYLNSGDNLTSANLDIIKNKYDDLNLIWLVKGTGPMLLTEELRHAIYNIEKYDTSNNILHEGHPSYSQTDVDLILSNMSKEQLLEYSKTLKQLIQAKNDVILAKDAKIAALKQLVVEKENANKTKDQLINQLQQKDPSKKTL